LPLILLSACATPEAVTEQTAPLGERIAALDSSLEAGLRSATATANEARGLAARHDARLSELGTRVSDQARQLQSLGDDLARLGTESTEGQARLRDELQARLQADMASTKEAMSQSLGQELKQELHRELKRELQQDLGQDLRKDLHGELRQELHQALRQDLNQPFQELGDKLTHKLDERLEDKLSQAEARMLAGANTHTDTRIRELDASLFGRMDQLERRLAEVARMAEEALAALGLGPRKIYGKVVHSVTLTDDKTLFPINSPDLGGKDMAKLDAVATFVKRLDVNYHIGIHGHTDGLGSDDYNYELGKARAEVVKNYLHEKQGIPLLRMSVISHGATDVSSYREGANRRIVVEVLQ
jgi:outer membrane protein OmpA-like peptidoglycan-associated protein